MQFSLGSPPKGGFETTSGSSTLLVTNHARSAANYSNQTSVYPSTWKLMGQKKTFAAIDVETVISGKGL